ncbi:hypothetical protein AAHC03_026928 [Spirometra sp. Aus1]
MLMYRVFWVFFQKCDYSISEENDSRTAKSSAAEGMADNDKDTKDITKSIYGAALLRKQIKLAEADRLLLEKRRYFQRKITASTARRTNLTNRQLELRDQMKKFEGFVRDNEAKRVRAISKYQTEMYLCKVRAREEADLKTELARVKQVYEKMKKKVQQYKTFEEYLMQVIDMLPPDYIKIADNVLGGLIMRYNTLYETNISLLKEMNEKSEQIREAHAKLVSLREEHASHILTLNSELAALYTKRERRNESFQRHEQRFNNTHRELRAQLSLFGTVIRSIDNLVGKCAWPYTAAPGDLTLSLKLNRIMYSLFCRFEDLVGFIAMVLTARVAMSGKRVGS